MKKLTSLIIIFSLLSGITVVFAQTSDQGEVEINAEVPQEVPQRGGGGFIPPPVPVVVAEPIPEHPEIPKSLIINEDKIYTNSLEVILSISAENAFQMAISNTPDFAGVSWEPYQTSKRWKLLPGDGKKIVYAKFRSPEGGVSETVSDTIILDTTPPTNVSNFEAISGDSQITLKWQNPPDSDFKAVKIMRSTKFYSSDPLSGVLVYDGRGTSLADTGLTNGVRYYYTAFAYDYAGNYSSGAIVSATPFKIKPPSPPPPEEITTEEECVEVGYHWYDDTCRPEPKIPPPPPEIEKLTLEDFDFWQEDKKVPLIEEFKIKAEVEKPLTISIDYEKVPEVLKTIMVTLEKEGKTFSFLLRVDKEKIAYQATMMPPEESGVYPLTIIILDYKNQTLKKISGQLEVEKPEIVTPKVPIPWYKNPKIWLYILGGLIILAGVGYLIIRWKIAKLRQKQS